MAVTDTDVARVLDIVAPYIESSRKSRRTVSLAEESGVCHTTTGPFVLALTGLQGSGKSTWANKLVRSLTEDYHFNAITVSLDDFYLEHERLVETASKDPQNTLLKTRGQPGTHDEMLAKQFFASLTQRDQGTASFQEDEEFIFIPSFDKSRFDGEGDRVPRDQWKRVSKTPEVDVVVFEGWCVGFLPLSPLEIQEKWKRSKELRCTQSVATTEQSRAYSIVTLPDHSLDHLNSINTCLESYCESFMGPQHFDYLVHLDTNNLANVFDWRMQQEHALREHGQGAMTDESVVAFVQGYMPAYELYLEKLRTGFFEQQPVWRDNVGRNSSQKGHTRLVLDAERNITAVLRVF